MHVPEYCTPLAGKPEPDGRYVSILCVLMHALSRGSVVSHRLPLLLIALKYLKHLRSSDPFQRPAIDHRYFSHEADMLMLIHAIRFANRVAHTGPLGSLVKTLAHPTPKEIGSDKALAEYIKTNLETAHHPIGTASMLPRKAGGVVDPQLKVYGTYNLR